MTEQLQLLPSRAPSVRRARVPVEQIDGWTHAQPGHELIELIRELGQLQPVLLAPTRNGRYAVIDGRRRTKTIALLAAENQQAASGSVDAYVLDGRDASTRAVRGGLTLALHSSRSDSPASELAAIENILKAAGDQDTALTIKQIAAQTDIPVQTVQRRLRLQRLIRPLRRAFDHGEITVTVAEACARLAGEQQHQLAEQLAAGARLTIVTVRDVAHEQTRLASDALPDDAFAAPDAAWQTTVLGHLRGALAATANNGHEALTEAIRTALAHLENT